MEVHGERVFALLYHPINAYRGVRVQDKAKGVEPEAKGAELMIDKLTTGVQMIAVERHRQIRGEGFNAAHDDSHTR